MASKSLIDHAFEQMTGRSANQGWADLFGQPLLDPSNPVGVSHILSSIFIFGVIVVLALIARRKYRTKEQAVIPEAGITVRNLFEAGFDYLFDLMKQILGEEKAKKFFPLIGTLGVFILLSNVLSLVPGIGAATANLNTNLAMAVAVTITYITAGVFEHGPIGYLKHLTGPSLEGANILLVAFVSFLMFFIEIIENLIVYPGSLALRLAANINSDHTVLSVFGDLGSKLTGFLSGGLFELPLFLPIPFYFFGLLIAFVQAFIFCILPIIYLDLATASDH
jgi:F-type H+-transporting ATPase subunit a